MSWEFEERKHLFREMFEALERGFWEFLKAVLRYCCSKPSVPFKKRLYYFDELYRQPNPSSVFYKIMWDAVRKKHQYSYVKPLGIF